MSLQPGNAPSRRNGPLWSKMAHGLEMAILAENTSFSWFVARAQNITTTVHFVGSGRFQAVSASREHVLHAPMSDQTLGRARGVGVHTCVHTPGPQ